MYLVYPLNSSRLVRYIFLLLTSSWVQGFISNVTLFQQECGVCLAFVIKWFFFSLGFFQSHQFSGDRQDLLVLCVLSTIFTLQWTTRRQGMSYMKRCELLMTKAWHTNQWPGLMNQTYPIWISDLVWQDNQGSRARWWTHQVACLSMGKLKNRNDKKIEIYG